jgi:hypothetical protein
MWRSSARSTADLEGMRGGLLISAGVCGRGSGCGGAVSDAGFARMCVLFFPMCVAT